MFIKNWHAGDLGISLPGAPSVTPPPPGAPTVSQRTTTWYDQTHIVLDALDLGMQTVTAIGAYGEAWGNGKLVGNDQDNYLKGGSGADTLSGNEGRDVLVANDGNDKLSGGLGDDALTGGDGDDYLEGNADSDVLSGGVGSDILDGGDGVDYLFGGGDYGANRSNWSVTPSSDPGGNVLFNQFVGNPYLADDGADLVKGGAGNDLLWGGEGADQLYGEADNDQLVGNSDNDYLFNLGDSSTGNRWPRQSCTQHLKV